MNPRQAAATTRRINNAPTAEGKAAAGRIAEFRQNVNNGATASEARATVRAITAGPSVSKKTPQPTVTADQLVTGAEKINPPAPVVNTNDGSQTAGLVGATANNTQQFIASQSENARKRDEMAQLLGGQTFDASGQRQALTEQYGLPDTLTRLTDIQTQLSSANTASGLRKVNIESGGQGAIQGVRSLTQEDRENAVRTAGLAAEASVLQGNIETASTLINNAMQDYYSDRTLKNQNMIQQLDYFSKIADEETAQLLEQEKRKYEADQEAVKEVKDSIRTAMQNGATAQEMRQFTDPSIDDATKLALAQTITARGANEIRQMEMKQAQLQLEATRASMRASDALANQRSGSVSGTGTVINASTDLGLTGTEEDPMLAIIANSRGGRVLTQSEAEPLTNSKRVADGLADLQAVVSQANTDPILGLFQKVNPYNLSAVAIDTAINTLVPQLARGTYGEVGVLTDADMTRYANTLPNLTSTEDQNKAVMALTLRKVRSGFASQIESMAAAGRDVSGYADIYQKFNTQIEMLEGQIGIGQPKDADIDAEYDEMFGGEQMKTSTNRPGSSGRGETENKGGFFRSIGKFFFGE